MWSEKSEGPRIDPSGTPYSCKDFQYRTTQPCLILRKDKVRLITQPEIP